MSKFDYDAFTGDYPLAVSKERYTDQNTERSTIYELRNDS